MTTKLTQDLRRQVVIDKQAYTLVISPQGLKLAEKGRRKGYELLWKDIVSGDAALAAALNASVAQTPDRPDVKKPRASLSRRKVPASKTAKRRSSKR